LQTLLFFSEGSLQQWLRLSILPFRTREAKAQEQEKKKEEKKEQGTSTSK
jgi:hypothetical protein